MQAALLGHSSSPHLASQVQAALLGFMRELLSVAPQQALHL